MENTGLKVGSVFYFLICEMKKIMKEDTGYCLKKCV